MERPSHVLLLSGKCLAAILNVWRIALTCEKHCRQLLTTWEGLSEQGNGIVDSQAQACIACTFKMLLQAMGITRDGLFCHVMYGFWAARYLSAGGS